MNRMRWLLGVMAFLLSISGSVHASEIWFVTQGTGGNYQQDAGHLWSWTPGGTSVTDRGTLNKGAWADIAMTPSGDLYGIRWTNNVNGGGTDLYRLTPGNSQQAASYTLIPNSHNDNLFNALGWADGGLWAAESATGTGATWDLYKWDLSSGGWINKNNHFVSGGDIELGPNGTLYAFSHNTSASSLYSIDRSSGLPTYLNNITGAVDNVLYGMAFDSLTGNMYGFNRGSNYGYGQGSDIYLIDPATGAATLALDLSVIGLEDNVWGATASPVPIPGAVWLLGSGLVGLAAMRRKARG
jgi:hypothetical protein